ncbi:hypothetical protein E4U53_005032 [Claviceps sorghi]|nr:hypothetical protein E4U53_005032 [Claviceps sorghi]
MVRCVSIDDCLPESAKNGVVCLNDEDQISWPDWVADLETAMDYGLFDYSPVIEGAPAENWAIRIDQVLHWLECGSPSPGKPSMGASRIPRESNQTNRL